MIRRIVPIAALLALAASAGWVIWLDLRAIADPYAIDYGEGPLLDQARRLVAGQSIYRRLGASPPWTVSNYPPMFPLVEAAFYAIVGPAYWYGRVVAAVGIFGAALLAGDIVRRQTGDRLAAAICALSIPAVPFVGMWLPQARIDGLALGLSLAGLWLLVRRPRDRRALVGAVALMAAAIFTRQTYLLAAPLAGFVWLLGISRRRAWIFAGSLAGTVALIGGILVAATGGGFWFNTVTANVNEIDLSSLLYYGTILATAIPVLTLSGLACTVLGLRRPDDSTRLAVAYLGGSLLVALTAVKVGSGTNYLLELSVSLSLATGLLVARVRDHVRLRSVVLLLLAAQAVVQLTGSGIYFVSDTVRGDSSASARLGQIVRTAGGPVLADQDMGVVALEGLPIELQPFETSELARAGVFDDAAVVGAIRAHRYAAILIYTWPYFEVEKQRWTAAELAAIDSSYEVAETVDRSVGQTLVYRPR